MTIEDAIKDAQRQARERSAICQDLAHHAFQIHAEEEYRARSYVHLAVAQALGDILTALQEDTANDAADPETT